MALTAAVSMFTAEFTLLLLTGDMNQINVRKHPKKAQFWSFCPQFFTLLTQFCSLLAPFCSLLGVPRAPPGPFLRCAYVRKRQTNSNFINIDSKIRKSFFQNVLEILLSLNHLLIYSIFLWNIKISIMLMSLVPMN